MQQMPDPGRELDVERLIEAERAMDAGDVGRCRRIAGDDRRRIAGAQMQQQKDEQRHHRHDRDGGEDASDDIGEHARRLQPFSRFPKKAPGATPMPAKATTVQAELPMVGGIKGKAAMAPRVQAFVAAPTLRDPFPPLQGKSRAPAAIRARLRRAAVT